eukprot:5959394-Alexandrium_andersonii.AAC.1
MLAVLIAHVEHEGDVDPIPGPADCDFGGKDGPGLHGGRCGLAQGWEAQRRSQADSLAQAGRVTQVVAQQQSLHEDLGAETPRVARPHHLEATASIRAQRIACLHQQVD